MTGTRPAIKRLRGGRGSLTLFVRGLCVCAVFAGCQSPIDSLFYFGEEPLQTYRSHATELSEPAGGYSRAIDAMAEPPVVSDEHLGDVVDISLIEALHEALANGEIIRNRLDFLLPGSQLLTDPDNVPSIHDSAIQETGFLFGRIGMEATLAAFDPIFLSSMTWGRSEITPNSIIVSNAIPDPFQRNAVTQEVGAFTAVLSKQFANSGRFSVSNNWLYLGSDIPGLLFPSSYTGFLRADYRQPLLAGAGTEYTRIAGPIDLGFAGVTGVGQGVVLARINNDITLAEFELAVTQLVKDVEDSYWDLSLAYRVFDSRQTALHGMLNTWRQVQLRVDAGLAGPGEEAQARSAYYAAAAVSQTALGSLLDAERRLRRMIGRPPTDGSVLRPADDPTIANRESDWHMEVSEAISRRSEIRRQKWAIKSTELQLTAAQSAARPRLDLVAGYQVNGFGDRLFGENDNDGLTAQGFRSGWETITQGNQTSWTIGLEFSVPLGLRRERSVVRNLELRLAKARTTLAEQETEVSQELAAALQTLDEAYQRSQTLLNQWQAVGEQLDTLQGQYDAGAVALDLLLRTQSQMAASEAAYYESVIRYNQAISEVAFRKGSLLEHNGITLAEGAWNPDAYREAQRRAWARSYGLPAEHLDTEPAEFVVPPIAP